MKGSYQMKKMKKVCAVLLAVLSVSLLASAFAGEDNNNKVENVTPVASDRPVDLDVGDLQMVAEFEQQVVGVAVSASGRVFVSFPRNGIDTVKKSVAEVIKGKAVAYPNEEINTLNTAAPSTHFLSAQSVYVDSSDTLWVLDVGNLGSGTPLISGGAKLVAIDLTTNAVKRTIVFPDSLITKGTSINDVRFDLRRGGLCVHPGFLSGGGQRHHRGGSVHRQRGAAAGERSHRAARPGFPRDRGGQAICHPGDGRRRAFTGIGRGRRHRGFGGRQAGVLLPDYQPELVFRGCRRADGFHPIRRRRGRDDQEPGRQGRSGWLGSGRAGARLSDERGVQRRLAVRSVAGNGGHFQPDV